MKNPATIYEEWFVPAVFAPLAREVIDRTEVPAGARVIDVACGSGIVARIVAPLVGPEGRVVGLDFNQAMLANARRAADAERLDIEWREGSAEDLPFEDGVFDLVFCQMGLQFFPNRSRAAREMHRVLGPGGQVVVSTWRGLDQNPFFAAFEQAVRQQVGSPAIEIPFSMGDPNVVAELLQDAGFTNISIEPVEIEASYTQPDRFIALQVAASAAAIPALQGLDATELESLIAAIREDMAVPVREATVGDRLHFPMKGIVARGIRK
jgi:ubiquinone/menaquinone biosynthesis C-methylase UbiE